MKLCSDGVWTIGRSHLKILGCAEKLMRAHEYIPIPMLKNKAGAVGNFHELALDLVNLKYLTYRNKMYKLSISGLDCLAINALRARGLQAMGSNIGIGKESDIYFGQYGGRQAAIKIHRLGRTSYRKVEDRNLRGDSGWFDLNKENCQREADFMGLFSGLPVPRILDRDRHVIVMELLDFDALYQVRVDNPAVVAAKMVEFVRRLWELGYVHGDFNEFNVMVRGDDIAVVDFPQCVQASDPRAAGYFKRDVECIGKHFWKKYFYICDNAPLSGILEEYGIKIEIERKEIPRNREVAVCE